ncbi:AraC family transcriptional regulator [Paenibacillus sp. N3.4]|uniref:AraC family transcriptional regulator n=1 Tax=Paenibacillus sp. N3.4 TaxID=2603222 RepID=UPI0021C2752B|nr:AraC family transcriptional regulator [Paenibacillus sp. N3.4]
MKLETIWRKRKSVIFRWLVSYTAVVFLPILMSVIMYREASINLKSEINRANDVLLEQVRDKIDAQIDSMKRLDTEITWNLKIQDLFYTNKPKNEAQYTAYQIVNDFKVYKTSYPSIDDFFVTWDQEQSVLCPGCVRDFQVAYDTSYNTGAKTYEEWLQSVLHSSGNRFILLPRSDASEPKQSLAYITHLPGGTRAKSPGTVVIMTDVAWFHKAVENIQGFSGGQVFIMDESNRVLISNTNEPPSALVLEQVEQAESTSMYKKNTFDQSEIFYNKSAVSGLKYVSIIPSQIYWKKAEYVRHFTYISIAISILGAALLTFFFMRRNYSPIQKLLQVLAGSNKDKDERPNGDEMGFIQKAVVHALSEKEAIYLQLQQQHHVLRSNMLNRLLKGKLDAHIPFQDAFAKFDIRLESDDFAVILFYSEDVEAFYSGYPEMELQNKKRLLYFIMTNVVEELVGQKGHRGYVAELDEMLACIVNFNEDEKDHRKEDLRLITAEAQQFLLQRFHIELTLSYSGIHPTLVGISQAYQEALDAMEYKWVLGKAEIISFDEIQKGDLSVTQLGYYYPLQVEQQLINFIKVGNFDKASVVLKDIADRNFSKPLASLTMARCLMFNMISTMIKTINEIGGTEDSFLAKNPHWMDQIAACDTIKEMYEQLIFILNDVCAYAASRLESNVTRVKTDSLRELIADVMDFVQQHYDDINLNVSMIGKQFDMKPSYLSQLFKQQNGEGLLDYIGKYRIEKAKQLISQSKFPLRISRNK